jgi:hypothetical protein
VGCKVKGRQGTEVGGGGTRLRTDEDIDPDPLLCFISQELIKFDWWERWTGKKCVRVVSRCETETDIMTCHQRITKEIVIEDFRTMIKFDESIVLPRDIRGLVGTKLCSRGEVVKLFERLFPFQRDPIRWCKDSELASICLNM